MTTFSVIIATYGRPDLLKRCLEGLSQQLRPADEVIVVTRPDDTASHDVANGALVTTRLVDVATPGVVAAMAVGLRASTSDWVAFTDDDAIASPTWIGDLEQRSHGDGVIGVGGRDVLEDDGVERSTLLTSDVGRIAAFGRFTGNHHRGTGGARSVAMLKGVNCAYDASLLGIPTGLFGTGAQAHFEIAIGLDLEGQGTLIYDPSVTVRHAPGTRLDGDRRILPSRASIADVASNAVLACGVRSKWFAAQRSMFSLAIGDASCPGVARFLVGITKADIRRRYLPSLFGTLRGLLFVACGRGLRFIRR